MKLGSLAFVAVFGLAACSTIPASVEATTPSDDADAEATQDAIDEPNRPNILILMFDDMRFDSFSYRGGPVSTPNIDALAAESTRFDMAITTTGLCSPSRAAFFTGRWGHRTGLDDNVELWHSRLTELNIAEDDIIQTASRNGYNVGYVGKWHLGANGPALRGADFVGAFTEETAYSRFYTPYQGFELIQHYNAGGRDDNGEKREYYQTLPGTFEDSDLGSRVTSGREFFAQAAQSEEPFFGVVSFQQPHPPYRVVEPYASMFDPAEIEMPDNYNAPRVNKPLALEYPFWPWHDVSHMTDADWRETRAHYYGAIAGIDRAVGELIAELRAQGLYDDMHIIFIGDQGSMIGEHGLYDKMAYAYDELMRIPLLIRDPSADPSIVERHVSLIDVPATIYDWMGVQPTLPLDGQSLAPVIEGTGELSGPDDALYAYEWYNGSWFGLRSLRTPGFKYVWNPGDSRDELYDLVNDPGELSNLIDSSAHSDTLHALRMRLHERLVEVEDPSAERLQMLIDRH